MSTFEETFRARTRRRPRPSTARHTAETICTLIVLLAVWEGCVRLFHVPPYILPSFSSTALAFYHGFANGTFILALGYTFVEILVGFVIGSLIGIVLGVALGTISWFDRLGYPYVVGFQTIPKVALAPLFVVWLGLGMESKIVIVTVTCIFPVVINTVAGLRSTGADRIALLQSLCGSRWQLLWHIQLPTALPYIFAGLNTASVLAVIGALVGEFVGGKQGLGVRLLQANFNLDLPTEFAILVILSLVGVALSTALRIVESKVCFWSGKTSG